jgi:adenylate cyclase class IV
MIEVEKKFKTTEEQLKNLLKDAEFVSKFVNHDIYYDTPGLELSYLKTKLRKRNGELELKVKVGGGVSEEISDVKKIKEYLSVSDLNEYIKNNMIVIAEFTTSRDRYKKDGIFIDIEKTDFGHTICELEVLSENNTNTQENIQKLKDFAKDYDIKLEKGIGKKREYIKLFKPDIYKKLYGESLKELKFRVK